MTSLDVGDIRATQQCNNSQLLKGCLRRTIFNLWELLPVVRHKVVPHALRQAGNLVHADGIISEWQEQSVRHPAVSSSKERKNRAGPTTKHAES
jgi:hypothetical protein